ncbi:uncharacterized protein A4U43_UnF1800 [Asparagus officinalis]|uniref:Uncharacterized protein n=1 Tax=Asparagus officinalis TaxID=4686 RepID=A0A1R3L7F7_ASPOF|nr:uncharacterized protein A4U43_UnF1800 [Asparagus officinalis]
MSTAKRLVAVRLGMPTIGKEPYCCRQAPQEWWRYYWGAPPPAPVLARAEGGGVSREARVWVTRTGGFNTVVAVEREWTGLRGAERPEMKARQEEKLEMAEGRRPSTAESGRKRGERRGDDGGGCLERRDCHARVSQG